MPKLSLQLRGQPLPHPIDLSRWTSAFALQPDASVTNRHTYALVWMKRLVILGSTGSIGTQALEIVAGSEELQVVGLAAGSSWEPAVEQAGRFGVPAIALGDEVAAVRARETWNGRVLAGQDGIRELIVESGADLVLNGMVGAAGLGPTVVALTEGVDVALANKESLVIGGELVMALAEATGARLLPVDSEHSALHQLIGSEPPGTVARLVLTASGGPFRGRRDLAGVTVADALAHPTWAMGGRITIDSATLMNKGFEAIEAHHLFSVPYDGIGVVVHPQSIVHSLIDLIDGASLAHLGYPDMKVPISYALHFPERAGLDVPRLDLAAIGELTFEQPDPETFACLRLAREAGETGGTAPCVLNAADEVAVAAFLDGRIPFTGIAEAIERVLEEMPARPVTHFNDLFDADAEARRRTDEQVQGLTLA
jgi:1-deoxy-D-xylulose-5-phosphate reductoisomerase